MSGGIFFKAGDRFFEAGVYGKHPGVSIIFWGQRQIIAVHEKGNRDIWEASPGFDSNALKLILADIYKNLYNPSMKIKPLKFIASSLDDLRNFPDEARRAVGFELYAIQYPFQKKTRKTSRQDIDLARQRYKYIGG